MMKNETVKKGKKKLKKSRGNFLATARDFMNKSKPHIASLSEAF
jgi:hypothetical protein